MNDTPKLYLAGIGMITPLGAHTAMTAAAVKAEMSGHAISEYYDHDRQPITLCLVPDGVFTDFALDTDAWDHYNEQHERIITMALLALHEAVSQRSFERPLPLVLALPESVPEAAHIPPELLVTTLLDRDDLPLSADKVRRYHTGRAAGIQGLELALRYLYDAGEDYVLLGGSDSHLGYARLNPLIAQQRLLTPASKDGFAPGEGAGFLLLTRHPHLALCRDHHIIALSAPGISQEPGHLMSDESYRGEGLDQAFKQALKDHTGPGIGAVYSSMNGEHYWAKEYGAAMIRNRPCFDENVRTEHPADCFGDLGAATGAVLMGLAAEDLFKRPGPGTHLVCASSDGPWRAAVRIEKIPTTEDM